MNDIAKILKKNQLKVTPQRIAIYNYLINTKEHPCADKIHKALERDCPSMSLATIYKTLDTFKNQGLIRELNLGENCLRYDADCLPHAHFLCSICNNVYDLPVDDELDGFKNKVLVQTGHALEQQNIYFYGKCSKCKN